MKQYITKENLFKELQNVNSPYTKHFLSGIFKNYLIAEVLDFNNEIEREVSAIVNYLTEFYPSLIDVNDDSLFDEILLRYKSHMNIIFCRRLSLKEMREYKSKLYEFIYYASEVIKNADKIYNEDGEINYEEAEKITEMKSEDLKNMEEVLQSHENLLK